MAGMNDTPKGGKSKTVSKSPKKGGTKTTSFTTVKPEAWSRQTRKGLMGVQKS